MKCFDVKMVTCPIKGTTAPVKCSCQNCGYAIRRPGFGITGFECGAKPYRVAMPNTNGVK